MVHNGYYSVKEIADKWGISPRRLQVLCQEGRIEGAIKLSNVWVIPYYASKPVDGRTKESEKPLDITRNADILESFTEIEDTFIKIMSLNYSTGKFVVYKLNQEERKIFDDISKQPMLEWHSLFAASGLIHPSDVEDYVVYTDPDHLKAFFKDYDVFRIKYRRKKGDDYTLVLQTIIKSKNFSENNQELMLYVQEIDSQYKTSYQNKVDTKAALILADVEKKNIIKNKTLFAGKHVLLVEDNELNSEISMELLHKNGFEVDYAPNGLECVNMIRAAKDNEYDFILMDILMPEIDGYETTRYIRSLDDKKKANIPIIALTAKATPEDVEKSYQNGMNGHISKPIRSDVLYEELIKIFNKQ